MTRRQSFILSVVVAVICIIPFLRTADYGFVNLDDYTYRFKSQIESGLSLQTFVWGLTFLNDSIWMPLTWCSYAFDVSLFGGTPGGMHIHNVILHGLNCSLLFLFLSSLLSQKGWRRNYFPALLIALFWGLHPLRVEPVAWIASRKDVLSLFFELLALLLWVKHLNTREGQSYKLYWLSFLFFVLATMAKPSAMTFPVIVLVLDIFIVRSDEGGKWNWKQYVPFFVYAAFIAGLAQHAQAFGGAVDVVGAPLWWRFLNAVASYGVYLFHTVWPSNLIAQCVCLWPEMPQYLWIGVGCVISIGSFIVLRFLCYWKTVREFKRIEDWPLAGFLIFTLVVGPFLGISSFGYHAYADRFTYVPSLGICLLLIWFWQKLSKRVLAFFYCVFPVVLAVLAYCTWRQARYWENDGTLYARTIEIDGDKSGLCHRALVSFYFEIEHNPEKVLAEYELSREADEELAMEVCQVYIVALYETGQVEKGNEVKFQYQRKLFEDKEKERREKNLKTDRIPTAFYITCAAQAIAEGDYETANDNLNSLYEVIPDYCFCHYFEGIMNLKQGEPEKALAAFRKIRPNLQDPYVSFCWLREKLPADDAEALKILPSLAWKEPDPPAK